MNRREDVFRRVHEGEFRRPPQAQRVRDALNRLAQNPDFEVLLNWLRHVEWDNTSAEDITGDASALMRASGRRTVIRKLERLEELTADDGPSDQHG